MSLEIEIRKITEANKKEPIWGLHKSITDNSGRVNIPATLRHKLEDRAKIIGQKNLNLYGVIKEEKNIQYLRVYDYPPLNHQISPHEINELELYGKNNERFSVPKNLIDFSNQELVFLGEVKFFDIYKKEDWQKKDMANKSMARSYAKGAEQHS